MLNKRPKIAIVGGGVAGVTTAIHLGELGLQTTLFEKEKSLVTGPPFCHLHAGGNLYREISDEQCLTLLKQSIDFLRFYPYIIDYRPTVIALPNNDKGTPEALVPRLNLLVKAYQKLIDEDPNNEVLGKSVDYYQLYERETLERLKSLEAPRQPKSLDEWMITAAQQLNLEKIKYPVIMVQEYGLNLFRLASGANLALKHMESVNVHTNTQVKKIQQKNNEWEISYEQNGDLKTESFDYLINAAGFRTGLIDDMLGVPCKRMVEFKAAYVSKWEGYEETLFPEIIIHGERGTPQGMGQFTPYPGGYVQLHGMTNNITLYEDGLVANSTVSCQPKLAKSFIQKIEASWDEAETKERTQRAIEHLAEYLPNFSTAIVGAKPLFGAQQIPGDDPTLRVAEVSFPFKGYARCEIVKVSSAIDMTQAILKELNQLGYIEETLLKTNPRNYLTHLDLEALRELSIKIATERNYPSEISNQNIPIKF